MIDHYLNMNLIFYLVTNDERRGTVVNSSWVIDGISIGSSYTNPLFYQH